jgi:hypothetical protein
MDDYTMLMKLATEMAAATVRAGKRTIRYSADNGIVLGWRLRPGRAHHEERRYSNATDVWTKEWWGNTGEIVLSHTGEFYEYNVASEDGGNPVVRRHSRTLRKLGPADLVGTTGTPFSEITTALRKLPIVSVRRAPLSTRRQWSRSTAVGTGWSR